MRQAQTQAEVQNLEGARQRFLAKVVVDGHWLWRGSLVSGGDHGWFRVGSAFNAMTAHRASWLLWRGDLPPAGRVVSACETRKLCVCPEHLREVELVAHRRRSLLSALVMQPHGEEVRQGKLSAAQVHAIIDLVERFGWTHREAATHFGVHRGNISRIIGGWAWSAVTGRKPGHLQGSAQ